MIPITITLALTNRFNESISIFMEGFRLHVKLRATIFGDMRFRMVRTVSTLKRVQAGKMLETTGF